MPWVKEVKRQRNAEAEANVSRDDAGRGWNVWLCLAADSGQKKKKKHTSDSRRHLDSRRWKPLNRAACNHPPAGTLHASTGSAPGPTSANHHRLTHILGHSFSHNLTICLPAAPGYPVKAGNCLRVRPKLFRRHILPLSVFRIACAAC